MHLPGFRQREPVLQKLQLKIIFTVLLALLLIITAVLLALNGFMHLQSRQMTTRLLEHIVETDGAPMNVRIRLEAFSEGGGALPHRQIIHTGVVSYVFVKLSLEHRVLDVRNERMSLLTEEEVETAPFIEFARGCTKNHGTVGGYQYLQAEKPYGTIVVFAERRIENLLLKQLTELSLWTAGVVSIVLLIFSYLFSSWAIFPVAQNLQKQRQFISNASHELKTPLTILSANTALLAQELGDDRKVQIFREQTLRMQGLIHDLLILARADEVNTSASFTKVNLSEATQNAALSFEGRAFEEKRVLTIDVAPDLICFGDTEQLKRLVSILVDNAINHSAPDGTVSVRLFIGENGKPTLQVRNSGSSIAPEDHVRIFERFFRADSSRARQSGGYGLGLAIAKTIVDAHKSSIFVRNDTENSVLFQVMFP